MDTRADVFASARPMLFSIAYRMLGSVMDAEDLVQEAWLRWEEARETEVRSPQAYLTTIVTRLAINQLRAARTKRETYVGPWLPEPLVTEDTPDTVELAESLSMAFLLLLERLGPVERAAFLLHEVFDFEYDEIARVLDKTEANCRQLVARARRRVGSPQARFEADPAQATRSGGRARSGLIDRAAGAAEKSRNRVRYKDDPQTLAKWIAASTVLGTLGPGQAGEIGEQPVQGPVVAEPAAGDVRPAA